MLARTFDMEEQKHEWKAGDLLSMVQAADYLDISRQRLHKLIKDGRIIGAYKVGEFWVVPFEAIQHFEPYKSGRPKKSSNESVDNM